MSNKTSRQRRKLAIAALPTITSQELIDLGLMNLNFDFITPRWLQDQADDMTLMQLVGAVRKRRAEWITEVLKAGHRPLDGA